MSREYRVLVIGGGVVGASVLYHLARAGWTDIALIERSELTAGSTWHAAAGFHALNADPNIAALQSYTIDLYGQIQAESGQDVGLHRTGGIELASSPERWEWLQSEWALFQTLDMEARLITPEEIVAMCPIVNPEGLLGGLYDPQEGRVDPHGTTHAYTGAAKKLGATLLLRNRVTELAPLADGGWRVTTEQGELTAEHVVNAGGLWARHLGHMVGVDLPVTPMEHHYLVTDSVPELMAPDVRIPSVTDMDGYTYLQPERDGVLLGVYERNPRHWHVQGAPWDFGMELLPEDMDRIAEELSIGFARFPPLQAVGIKRWVNGAFTFTPDGNPLVGPVPGLKNYWAACGCMAGFSQGGAIGLALANWMVDGDPGFDVYGMDVARFGTFASSNGYLKATTRQFYARRFSMVYPNEELPAGRPLKTTPCYDVLRACGARFGAVWGMETPLYFAPEDDDFVEAPSLSRSNAHDLIGAEAKATRAAAGLFETAIYARYEVSGSGAAEWLDGLLASRLPAVGRVRLAPMLGHEGRLMGDLTVSRLAEDRFWLIGSYAIQEWHLRWFREQLPSQGVALQNLSDTWLGFSLSGPAARSILAVVLDDPAAATAMPFLSCQMLDVGLSRAMVARLSLTGELGFEITVPALEQRALWSALTDAGADFGLRQIGLRALDSLRFEKGYGAWLTEFTQAHTPAAAGLAQFIDYEKPAFIGRDAVLKAREQPPDQRLVLLEVDAANADAAGFEPVWSGANRVGYVTSGGYGHCVGKSLALAYVDHAVVEEKAPVTVHVVGEARPAQILAHPPYDPAGERLRA